jgi:protein SCO1/2
MNRGSNWKASIRQWRQATAYCLLFTAYCLLSSCGPKTDDGEVFSITGVPRLAKYYPQVDEKGDTTYDTPAPGTFIDQSGDSFSTTENNGHIQAVQIFFTTCQGICPVITNNMSRVQKEFAGNDQVRMISYSVDPERDSIPALQEYAHRFEIDPAKWKLLTGQKKLIYDMIRYEYLLPNVEPGTGGDEDFIHSDQIVLIDRNNIIRGYYGGTDTAQVRMLIEDIHTLINEK